MQAGLETGLKFSIALMREIQSVSKEMLVNALEYMHQTLRNLEPGALYSTDKLSFMIDANLNDARAFLVSVIENSNNPERAIELSFKIILLIGIARSNIEDLLIVATLVDKQQPHFDLRQELAQLRDESQAEPEGVAVDFSETIITKKSRVFLFSKEQLNEAA